MTPSYIYFTLLLWISISDFKGKQSVYPINSHVAARVWKGNKMTEYYKKDNWFKFDYWIVPVHLGVHWAMMVCQ